MMVEEINRLRKRCSELEEKCKLLEIENQELRNAWIEMERGDRIYNPVTQTWITRPTNGGQQ